VWLVDGIFSTLDGQALLHLAGQQALQGTGSTGKVSSTGMVAVYGEERA
jgi:hypothetical protein